VAGENHGIRGHFGAGENKDVIGAAGTWGWAVNAQDLLAGDDAELLVWFTLEWFDDECEPGVFMRPGAGGDIGGAQREEQAKEDQSARCFMRGICGGDEWKSRECPAFGGGAQPGWPASC
jgi:hypothetical protein